MIKSKFQPQKHLSKYLKIIILITCKKQKSPPRNWSEPQKQNENGYTANRVCRQHLSVSGA